MLRLLQQGEFYNKKKNGQFYWENTSISPVKAKDGTITHFLAIGDDVTDRKRAEDALKDAERRVRVSEERYALVLDGMRDAVWDYNITDNILYTSPRFADLLGYGPNKLNISSEGWLQRIHPKNKEKYQSHLIAHLKGETPFYSCEYQVANNDGDYIWVLDRGKALCDETGRACRMAGYVTNITKRRLAEDGLRQSQKLAAVGKFSSGIAHEFNNILVGIRGFTDMAILDADNPEDVVSHLEEVQGATDRAAKLTKDMLAFSRGQDVKVTRIIFDLCEIIDETETFLKSMLPPHVHVHSDIEKRDILINGDPQQISQVLLNLCINAKDAMPDGGDLTIGLRTVQFEASQIYEHPSIMPGSFAQIFVMDTGTGIDNETFQRLFEPFYTTKELGKGTGLGLSVVHGFVEKMDGFIDLKSTLGEGTTFLVNLPLLKK